MWFDLGIIEFLPWVLIGVVSYDVAVGSFLLTECSIKLLCFMLSGVVKESICHMRIFFLISSELVFTLKGFVLKVFIFCN